MVSRLLKYLLYKKLIRPITRSEGSIRQVSWGVGIGVFFALTPTVGIQMYAVALIWALCRYILNTHFNLPVAIAMVWISNPLTMIPLYYLFLVSGYVFLETQEKLSFALFEKELSSFSQMESAWDSIVEATRFLIIDLGWPMVVGSLFFAIPGAFLSYWITAYLLKRYRLQRLKHRQFVANGSQPVDQPVN